MVSFNCCRKNYSTRDPETYVFITKYKAKYPNDYEKEKIKVGEKEYKIDSETIFELACVKNGCTKLKIFKYSYSGLLLEKSSKNKKEDSITYLNNLRNLTYESTSNKKSKNKESELLKVNILEEIPLSCPVKKAKYGKRIPLFYGKPVNNTDYEEKSLCEQMSRGISTNTFILIKEERHENSHHN